MVETSALQSYIISSFFLAFIFGLHIFCTVSGHFCAGIVGTGGLPVTVFSRFTFSDHTSMIV